LLESPLDQIEPYQTFRQALTSKFLPCSDNPTRVQTNLVKEMQQEQPQFYASLASHLTAEEQNTIQATFAQAQAIAAQQQQQILQAQQQAVAQGSAPNSATLSNGGAT
jgi:importin-7